MSKKSRKAKLESPKTIPIEEVQIENLCDDEWTCDVVFLIESDVPTNNFINIFQQLKTIKSGVKCITKNDTLKEIKKGAGKKSSSKSQKKGKDRQPVELTDEQRILKAVKEDTSLPSEPLAKVIKKTMMRFKNEDLNERRKLYAQFLQSQKKKPKPQSKKKGSKKAQKPPPPEDKKIMEESYIESSPLFIIISGFYEYDLPLELLKVDVPVRAVIKLTEPENLETEEHQNNQEFGSNTLEAKTFTMNWLKFWFQFTNLMDCPINAQLGTNLAIITRQISHKAGDTSMHLKDKKLLIQNEIQSIIEYIQKLLERHKLYLSSTYVYNIPPLVLQFEEASVYHTLTKMVPLECTSIQFVMFCIIEQVCFSNGEEIDIEYTCNDKNLKNSFKPSSPVIIMHNDEDVSRTFHLKIPEIDLRKITKNLLTTMLLFKPFKQLQNNQMDTYFYEFHLQRLWKHIENKFVGMDLFYIYLHWFILCKINAYYVFKMKNQTNKRNNNDSEINGLNGKINDCNFCEGLIYEWIDELIRYSVLQLVSEDDQSTVIDSKHELVTSTSCTMLDHECFRISNECLTDKNKKRCRHDCKSVKKIKKARKFNLKALRNFLYCFEVMCLREDEKSPKIFNYFKNFRDYEYIEEMSPDAMLQIIQESVLNFCYTENFYYPPTNKILLWFHNDTGKIYKENFSVELNTLVGFRDFYNTVVLPKELELQKMSKRENNLEHPNGSDSELTDLSEQRRTNSINSKASETDNADTQEEEIHFNLGETKIKMDRTKKKFISEDGTTVTVETDNWYKTSKRLKININKINTELNIYKNVTEKLNSNTFNEQADEHFDLIYTLPNGIFLKIPVVEKNTFTEDENQDTSKASKRKFIYDCFTVTLPTGLIIEILKNKLDDNKSYIKQSYLSKGPDCNQIWNEKCRCLMRNGTIILFKNDETIDIIYSNTVKCKIRNITETFEEEKPVKPLTEPIVAAEQTKEKKNKKKKNDKTGSKGSKKQKGLKVKEVPETKETEIVKKIVHKVTEHTVTSWSGINYDFKDDICIDKIDNDINLRTIFLPYTQLFIDRNDGVKCLLNENGDLVTMLMDGTKLTTYFHEEEIGIIVSEDIVCPRGFSENFRYGSMSSSRRSLHLSSKESGLSGQSGQLGVHNLSTFDIQPYESIKLGCIMEHPNYATVEFFPTDESIVLTLPGGDCIKINETNHKESYDITVTSDNKMELSLTEVSIEFTSNISKEFNRQNITTVSSCSESENSDKYSAYFCRTFDSFGNVFLVDNDGDVKLTNLHTEQDIELKGILKSTTPDLHTSFNETIPKNMFNRFFVVNEDYSGYEIINKNDLILLDEVDKRKYNNFSVVRNPSQGRIDSKTTQHLIYKTHSENYSIPYITGDLLTLPNNFKRMDLGPTWTPSQSPWFLVRSEHSMSYFKSFSFTDNAMHNDRRVIAVVIKIVQKIINDDFNGVNIILNCLEKCNDENKELYKKYKNQSFTDFEVDSRLKETHELICKIKTDFPHWNVVKKVNDCCKQEFGQLHKTKPDNASASDDNSESFERIVNKVDY